MADYIKRTDVMKICEDYSEHCFNSSDSKGQDVADRILDDVVEIPAVDGKEIPCRCGECKYADDIDFRVVCQNSRTPWWNDDFNIVMDKTDFCSYGERRDT